METFNPKNYLHRYNKLGTSHEGIAIKHDFKHVCYVGIAWDSIIMQNCFQVVKNKLQKNTPPSFHMNV